MPIVQCRRYLHIWPMLSRCSAELTPRRCHSHCALLEVQFSGANLSRSALEGLAFAQGRG